MKQITIIKIGGEVIDHADRLDQTLSRFAGIEGPKLLVHGGGKMATRLAEKLGIQPVMIEGRRVTDAQSLEIVQMVYAGLINKNIVAALSARQCPAVGFSGADADTILVMDNGRIIEKGGHRELLQQKGVYHKLFRIQIRI